MCAWREGDSRADAEKVQVEGKEICTCSDQAVKPSGAKQCTPGT